MVSIGGLPDEKHAPITTHQRMTFDDTRQSSQYR